MCEAWISSWAAAGCSTKTMPPSPSSFPVASGIMLKNWPNEKAGVINTCPVPERAKSRWLVGSWRKMASKKDSAACRALPDHKRQAGCGQQASEAGCAGTQVPAFVLLLHGSGVWIDACAASDMAAHADSGLSQWPGVSGTANGGGGDRL